MSAFYEVPQDALHEIESIYYGALEGTRFIPYYTGDDGKQYYYFEDGVRAEFHTIQGAHQHITLHRPHGKEFPSC